MELISWLLVVMGLAAGVYSNKVLLVSMDGFRWDYIQRTATPHFDALAERGTRADFINNTFITKTFPCHYSIATGLYEESHGIISNAMYDPITGQRFNMGSKETFWWDGGEPLWVTVEKAGLKSATYYWPGSESVIRGHRPTEYRKYNESVEFNVRVDTVVDWLTDPEKDISFAMLYFHEPDLTGHVYGPDSEEVLAKVRAMDEVLGYIVSSFDSARLWESVNLIVTSDHGMTQIDSSNLIDLLHYVSNDVLIQVPPSMGSTANIMVAAGKVDEVLRNLSRAEHMDVYRRQDVPERFHYSNNPRILDIVAIADEHWTIVRNASTYKDRSKGAHGYDNTLMSMKPIFYARGPNIAANTVVEPFNSVDIYPMVCNILGIQPAPNNGSLENIRGFLKLSATNGASHLCSVYAFLVMPLFLHLHISAFL